MALLMEPGAEPLTESEQADLAGIAAIKEAAAREYKEQGNQFVRMGRKHYAEAVSCYTKAIAQMEPLSSLDTGAAADASVLFANRAHVNLLLGNHRRALDDAEQAIRLSPSSVKLGVLPGGEGGACARLVAGCRVLLPEGARAGPRQ